VDKDFQDYMEAGGFESNASHFCKSFCGLKLWFKSFSCRCLDLSHALSAFIRIYQNFLLEYSRFTPVKIGKLCLNQ
jgi:hypothetical protein